MFNVNLISRPTPTRYPNYFKSHQTDLYKKKEKTEQLDGVSTKELRFEPIDVIYSAFFNTP